MVLGGYESGIVGDSERIGYDGQVALAGTPGTSALTPLLTTRQRAVRRLVPHPVTRV